MGLSTYALHTDNEQNKVLKCCEVLRWVLAGGKHGSLVLLLCHLCLNKADL